MLEQGSLVWVPDGELFASPARVTKAFERGTRAIVHRLRDNRNVDISAETSKTLDAITDERSITGLDDLVGLRDLNDASLLHSLRVRFKEDKIYTNIGSVLISVNPFQELPIFTPTVLEAYRTASETAVGKLPPHLYATAANAYESMLSHRRSQCVLISGESGSGKTEATKVILQYLTEVSRGKEERGVRTRKGSVHPFLSTNDLLQEQILKANPLLESFGNAMTQKNKNSSRFGKWIEIRFNNRIGCIVGGSVTKYLLEKSRVVQQQQGESNYHIFSELCAAASLDKKLAAKLKLRDASEYAYLTGGYDHRNSMQRASTQVSAKSVSTATLSRSSTSEESTATSSVLEDASQSDAEEATSVNYHARSFQELLEAMAVLKISQMHIDHILSTVSAILHLGNVSFEETSDGGCKVAADGMKPLQIAAEQLGLEAKDLSQALRTKKMSSPREVVYRKHTVAQASEARDGLAKAVYAKLFDWLIHRVNVAINGGNPDGSTMSLMSRSDSRRLTNSKSKGGAATASAAGGRVEIKPSEDESNTQEKDDKESVIGVLDIFGFEDLSHASTSKSSFFSNTNSFEQLCINHCNQKLQVFFAEHVFKLEMEEYAKQGIDTSRITYDDHAGCVHLFESRPNGVFALLDEEVILPRGSSDAFLNKLFQSHPINENLSKRKGQKMKHTFTITHYAGKVTYVVIGMLDKNKDMLHVDLDASCKSSKNAFVARLFSDNGAAAMLGKKKSGRWPARPSLKAGSASVARRQTLAENKKTLGAQFKEQLKQLVETLGETNPHFVRCIKPTNTQKSGKFDSMLVLGQLKHSGVLDVCRIKKHGYPCKESFKAFMFRYAVLSSAGGAGFNLGDGNMAAKINSFCKDLVKQGALPTSTEEVHKNKRNSKNKDKGHRKGRNSTSSASVSGRSSKPRSGSKDRRSKKRTESNVPASGLGGRGGGVSKQRSNDWQIGTSKVFMRQNVYDTLEARRVAALAVRVTKIQACARGKQERQRSVLAMTILKSLKVAVEQREEKSIVEALQGVGELPNGGKHLSIVNHAHVLLDVIREETAVLARLVDAVKLTAGIEELREACGAAKRVGKLHVEYDMKAESGWNKAVKEAKKKLKVLEKREEAIFAVRRAVSDGTRTALSAALAKAKKRKISCKDSEDVKRATALLDRLEKEEAAVSKLNKATKSRKAASIRRAVGVMLDLGLDDHPAVAEGRLAAQSTEKEASAERHARLLDLALLVANARNNGDMDAFDRIRTAVTELGGEFTDPAVLMALKTAKQVELLRPVLSAVTALCRTLNVKAHGAKGIKVTDLDPLSDTLRMAEAIASEAETDGLPIVNIPELSIGQDLEEDLLLQLKLQELLKMAYKTKEIPAMKKALDAHEAAVDLDLSRLSVLQKVQALVRDQTMNLSQAYAVTEMPVLGLEEEKGEGVDQIGAVNDANVADVGAEKEPDSEPKHVKFSVESSEQIRPVLPPRRRKAGADGGAAGRTLVKSTSPSPDAKNARRIEDAVHPKFDFGKYYAIRDDADFAKGVFFHKRRVIDLKLSFQSQPIHRSLLRLDPELAKVGTRMHKSILGYCGDLMMSFHSRLAEDLLTRSLAAPQLADELYIQLFKHLTKNPGELSRGRCWQLICIAVGTLAPSRDFEMYVFNFLATHRNVPGIDGTYASFALRQLELTLDMLPKVNPVPTIAEIDAFAERPPVLANIFLADGSAVATELPVLPSTNVSELVRTCAEFVSLGSRQARMFGIFTQESPNLKKRPTLMIEQSLVPIEKMQRQQQQGRDDAEESIGQLIRNDKEKEEESNKLKKMEEEEEEEAAASAARPMGSSDFIGDRMFIATQHDFSVKFVFKCKLFLPTMMDFGADTVFDNLVYLQARDEIQKGNWPIDQVDQVAELAALSLGVVSGGEFPKSPEDIAFDDLQNSVPRTWWHGHDSNGLRPTASTVTTVQSFDEQGVLNVSGQLDNDVRLADSQEDFGSLAQVWAARVFNATPDVPPGVSAQQLTSRFLTLTSELDFFGVYFAFCKLSAGSIDRVAELAGEPELADELDSEMHLACGVNANGLFLCTLEHEVLVAVPFGDIKDTGRAGMKMWVNVAAPAGGRRGRGGKISFFCPQAKDIVSLLRDYAVELKHTFGRKGRLIAKKSTASSSMAAAFGFH